MLVHHHVFLPFQALWCMRLTTTCFSLLYRPWYNGIKLTKRVSPICPGLGAAEEKKNRKQRWLSASVQENKPKHTRGNKWTLFNIDKKMCEFSAYVAFNKATNGQTDINKTRNNVTVEDRSWKTSPSQRSSFQLPPSQRSSFQTRSFAKVEAVRLRSSTVTFSCTSLLLFVFISVFQTRPLRGRKLFNCGL